jgi:hypothetical protein
MVIVTGTWSGCDGEPERFRGLEVDNEIEFRGLLDGEIGGLAPLKILST